MGDHDNPPTCLSSKPHDKDVRDVFLHYAGCLRAKGRVDRQETGRQEYFDKLNSHQRQQIRKEEKRISELRSLFDNEEEGTEGLAKQFQTSIDRWRADYWNRYPSRRRNPQESSINGHQTVAYTKPSKENGFGMHANMVFFKNSLPHNVAEFPDEFPDQKISIEDLLYKRERTKNPLMKECGEDEIRYFHLPGNNMEWVEEAIARHYNEERPEYDGLFRRPENPSRTYMLLRPEFWRGQQHGGRHDAVHARHMRPRCDIISTDPENLEDTPKNLVLFMPYLHWETDRRRAMSEEIMRKTTSKHKWEAAAIARQSDNVGNFVPPTQNDLIDSLVELDRPNGTDITQQPSSSAMTDQQSQPRASLRRLREDSVTPLSNGERIEQQAENGTVVNATVERPEVTKTQIQDTPNEPGINNPNSFEEGNSEDLELRFEKTRTATEVIQAKIEHEIETDPKSKFSKTKLAKRLKSSIPLPHKPLGKVLFHAAMLSEAMDCYHDGKMLEAYLHNNPPFHPRRTLDQSYYWTLKTTKKRDRDQVVYRGTAPKRESILCQCPKQRCKHEEENNPCDCFKKGCKHEQENSRKIPRVVMVDQLWLWILNGNTLITSFPKRFGRNKPDPSAVHKTIRMRLRFARKNEIRSVYDLALIIIDQCAKVFFDRTKTADRKPQVMDLFATAIGNVTNQQTTAYDHFWHTTQEASNVYKSADTAGDIENKAKSLLDINPEGKLLREIKDILDELNLLINIKTKQQRVFKEFNKHVEYMIARPLALSKEIGTAKQKRVTGDATGDNEGGEISQEGEQEKEIKRIKAEKNAKAEADAKWTLQFALDLAACLDDRVADLINLKENAQHTEKALDGLLGLKQQQAGVVQAREAVRQAEETLRQGRSIMLFTVITIIFLPLSFGASIFGMNAAEFDDGKWSLLREIKYMLPISCGIILTSFILAFSTFTRAMLSYAFDVGWTYFVTRSGLYMLWHEFKLNSKTLRQRRKETTRKMKENARAQKQESRKMKHKKREDKRENSQGPSASELEGTDPV